MTTVPWMVEGCGRRVRVTPSDGEGMNSGDVEGVRA